MPSPQSVPRQARAFGSMRLFMALVVLTHHANHDLGTEFGGAVPRLFDGVAVFFILSGLMVFSSAESVVRRGLGWQTFFRKRYVRLVPALLVFALLAPVLLCLLGVLSFSDLVATPTLGWLASAAFLVPMYDPPALVESGAATINDQLYTLPAEFTFYLLVPLLLMAARRWPIIRVVSIVALVSTALGVLVHYLGREATTVYQSTFLEKAPYFMAGILLARFGSRIPLRWWLALPAAVLSSALIFVDQSGYLVPLPSPARPLLAAVPLAYSVLYVGLRLPTCLRSVPTRVGDLSYGVYLWHPFVLFLVLRAGGEGRSVSVVIAMVVSLVLAFFSFHLIERPAQKRLSHPRPRPVDVVPEAPA